MDILKKIEEYASLQGDRTAFRSLSGEISYKDLWKQSGRLASAIDDLMHDDKKPVIVYGHKDPMMIVCFLACVRSGRAYCPVDVNTPTDRIGRISSKIGKPLVLMTEKTASAGDHAKDSLFPSVMSFIGYEELSDMAHRGDISQSLKACAGEDDFYIIFTSGTTGNPKGVRITSDDLNNYLNWAVTLAGGIDGKSVFLNQAPYSFDLSVMDLYLSLATGGTVVSVDSGLQKESDRLMEYLAGSGVNYWVSTPSFAGLCLADERFDNKLLPCLKGFLFCGEVLPNQTALKLIRRFPNAKVINTYGPTESTVCVTDVEITEEMASGSEPLPVGKSKPGTWIQIETETSEIIIMGDTVSPGYYKEDELTSASFFIHSPNTGADSITAAEQGAVRAYRTGDKGHYGDDGMLYCDGRIDNQIKLHGYRIEIEDIESNLTDISGIEQAAVAQRIRSGAAESLTAFVVRRGNIISDDYSGRRTVRIALRETIPSYMVPKRIIFLDELPLTNNGKLDRKRLKEMA